MASGTSLKKGWNWVWSKTDIDEKAVETARNKKKIQANCTRIGRCS